MKKLCLLALSIAAGLTAWSQTPIITLHSDCYNLYGEGAFITLGLGSTQTGVVYVETDFGMLEYDIAPAIYDQESQDVVATYIPCEIGQEGVVTIYGDESMHIDYVNCDGCSITEITLHRPADLDMLSLRHNLLKAIDCSAMTDLSVLDLSDNPFDESAAIVGPGKPYLSMLSLSMVGNLDPNFSLTDYPSLVVFEAYGSPTLLACDPTQCPNLAKLSIDGSSVPSLDVSQNPNLLILNVSESGVNNLDLSNNPLLQELYVEHRSSYINLGRKFTSLDLSHNPLLRYLFCSGNWLEHLDLKQNPHLQDLYCRDNLLQSLDLSANTELLNVFVTDNYMNFNTLPVNPGTWQEYEYRQHPLQVPSAYLLGSEIDLSSAVVRDDSETYMAMFSIDPEDPSTFTQLDASFYSYDNGKVTITQAIADSVFLSFYNPVFPAEALNTTHFKVKTAAQYGKPDLQFTLNAPSLSTTDRVKMQIGMAGATDAAPKTFYVDFGDGQLREFAATSFTLPETANVNTSKGANGEIKVYAPEGEIVTAIGFADAYVSSIDLSAMEGLRYLSLRNTQLYNIDLSRNRKLESLQLTGNYFGESLNLDGINGAFSKNWLRGIDLSNNQMTAVKLNPVEVIEKLNLSNNQLSSLDFTEAEWITDLDLSNNDFEYLKINYLSSLRNLNLKDNKLNELILPETNVIEHMDIRNNAFTLANMPERHNIAESDYLYAPQQPITISAKGPGCNLSSQALTIDGHATQFTWKTQQGTTLVAGTDYEINDGITRFLDPTIGKSLYCEITNDAFPAFSGSNVLRTTNIISSGQPKHIIGTFKTLDTTEAQLSLASLTPANSIYIDWGDGALVEYPLETTYNVFTATTIAGAEVKIHSYDAVNDLSVFSVRLGRLANVDLSAMSKLVCLSITGAAIDQLQMPQSDSLTELFLNGNEFSTFDFNSYPSLKYVGFSGNKFQNVDLSGLAGLEEISFANNDLTSITLQGNTNLWGLYLSNNKLTEIDLSGVPNLYQTALNYNQLSHIDLDGLEQLKVVYIDHNCMDFHTLPKPREQWTLYVYGDQQPITVHPDNRVVDLSQYATVDDTPTEYVWIMGEPWYDEESGSYMADILYEGVDYTINNGVTTFINEFEDVRCLMYNDVFPQMVLTTNMMNILFSGIDDINVDPESFDDKIYDDKMYNALGQPVAPGYKGFVIKNGKKLFIK